MYVVPHVDRLRMAENISAAMAAADLDAAGLAKAAKVPEQLVADVMRGVVHPEALAKLGAALKRDDLAPLINLRDPDRRDMLPIEGRDVPETEWWLARIRDGDVRQAEPPKPAEPAKLPAVVDTPQPAAG